MAFRAEADETGAMPEVDEDVATPVRALGRFGLVAYGVVHLFIAALVVQIAFGDRERADKKGALAEIGSTAAGVVLLWVITVGLAALVVWQLGEAVLAYSAASVAVAGGEATPKPSFAQVVLALPGGAWLVGLAGAVLVVGGGYAVWRGITHGFLRELDLRGAGLNRSRLVTRVGQVGWVALGAVYGIPGVLLVVAAVQHDPAQPVGLDAGLKALAGQPFGPYLLLVLAAGLVAFGVHCLVDARYRRA